MASTPFVRFILFNLIGGAMIFYRFHLLLDEEDSEHEPVGWLQNSLDIVQRGRLGGCQQAGVAIMIEGSGIILVSLILRELLVANYLAFITLTPVILMATIMKYARDASKMSKSLAFESKT